MTFENAIRERFISLRKRRLECYVYTLPLIYNSIFIIHFKNSIVLLSILLSSGSIAFAQNANYIFRHITAKEGLISNKVNAIYQDREGFMWIGTMSGLQRYDGTKFKNYLSDIRDSLALQSDWISSIFEDRKKRFWIGTGHGSPYILNRSTGKFYNYNLHAASDNKIKGIWHFAEDKQGNIWIATLHGYYKLNEESNQFEKFNSIIGLDKKTGVGYLTIDENDNLWLATTDGVKFYNRQENKLYSKDYNPMHNPIFDIKEGISNIVKSGNNIWVSTAYFRILYQYNVTTLKLKAFTFDKRSINKKRNEFDKESLGEIFNLQEGRVIIPLMARGLAVYHPESDDFAIIEGDNTKSYNYFANENSVGDVCFALDRENNLWIGNESGINIFKQDKQFFFSHGQNDEKDKLFPKTSISDFLELPDGTILISYYYVNGGIVKVDSLFQFKNHYLAIENGNKNASVNQIWNLFKDEKNIVWAPNQKNTILKLNISTDKILEEIDTSLSGPITTIKQDSPGIIWLGHWKKGLVKEEHSSSRKQFFTNFLYADYTIIKRVQTLLLDSDKIWVGTYQSGLQVFDKKKESFIEAFVVDEKNKTGISSNSVVEIIRYSKDTLILATEMGINIFNTKNKTFNAITAKDGLPNNITLAVMRDDAGNLWVACANGGFCMINMSNFAITSYDVNDGITNSDFSTRFYKLKNGTVLIGTTTSFISFNPSEIKSSLAPEDVCITGIHIYEKEMRIDSLLNAQLPLSLSYQDNSLLIEFSVLQFWAPGNIQYFYKLDGVDKDWIQSNNSHAAVYNQLIDGTYFFNVKCKNRDGIFSKHITQIKIIINPPFWKTWWFASVSFLFVLSLIYLFVKWREGNIKAIELEKLKIQQLNAEQYKSKLELEQIINYFSSTLIGKITIEDALWDVAKNLIGQLGFVDCMIYLWNEEHTKMIQKAGYGPKGSVEEINKLPFDVLPGQGVVGYVLQTKEPVLIADTALDSRYRADEMTRSSEITVPVIYNNELIGIIDCEHHERNFFTQQHLQILSTIATLMANKIKSIEVEQSLHQTQIKMYSMNEQLSKAKLEALRSQMNPHFMFNSLNAIQECILTNKVDAAYEYLSKFSKLQRMVLNNSEKELIPLSSELEMLELYLSLESLRFSNSFTYSFIKAGETDAFEIMIPSLITQPLVENAIWHGLRNKDGEKILKISFEEKNGFVFIMIDDNGIGREKAAFIKSQKLGSIQFASKGTILLEQRLHVLSQQLHAELRLEIIDKKDISGIAIGTKVIISFPANLEVSEE